MKFNRNLKFDFDFYDNQYNNYETHSINSTTLAMDNEPYKMPNLLSMEGRVGRLNWWIFEVINISFVVLFIFIHYFAFFNLIFGYRINITHAVLYSLLLLVMYFVFTVMRILNTIKRLHDINLSALMAFCYLIPIFGYFIIMLLCGFVESVPYKNKYGPSPKQNNIT